MYGDRQMGWPRSPKTHNHPLGFYGAPLPEGILMVSCMILSPVNTCHTNCGIAGISECGRVSSCIWNLLYKVWTGMVLKQSPVGGLTVPETQLPKPDKLRPLWQEVCHTGCKEGMWWFYTACIVSSTQICFWLTVVYIITQNIKPNIWSNVKTVLRK